MKLLRAILPFLFVRNWYTGELELSRPRVTVFLIALVVFMLLTAIIITLRAPVEYAAGA